MLAELPAGEYTVTAEAAGLSPSAQNVQVNVGLVRSARGAQILTLAIASRLRLPMMCPNWPARIGLHADGNSTPS